jgi:class 3 adenylate cyclase
MPNALPLPAVECAEKEKSAHSCRFLAADIHYRNWIPIQNKENLDSWRWREYHDPSEKNDRRRGGYSMGTSSGRYMKKIFHFLIQPTGAITSNHVRAYAVFSVGIALACLIHLVYVMIFWSIGASGLVYLNFYFSIPLYLVAFVINRHGLHFTTALLAQFELMVHQSFAIYILGWGAGMQYYLLSTTGIIFSLPPGRTGIKILMLAANAATYNILFTIAKQHSPAIEVHSTIIAILYYVNSSSIFALLGFFAWHYHRTAEIATNRLEEERRKADALLHNILPTAIVERLKQKPEAIADGFREATVLFADLVNFTPLSENMSPDRLIDMLNEIFSQFDQMVKKRGLEKIKTIGDAYMVAAGIPEPRADHAEALAGLAIEMMAFVKTHRPAGGYKLNMRIGLHSGPVVAGVIGRYKFAYDLWGDTVNTAARMESHSIPGEIQLSQSVYDRISDKFQLEERGFIEIKGKEARRTWLLKGIRDMDSCNPAKVSATTRPEQLPVVKYDI